MKPLFTYLLKNKTWWSQYAWKIEKGRERLPHYCKGNSTNNLGILVAPLRLENLPRTCQLGVVLKAPLQKPLWTLSSHHPTTSQWYVREEPPASDSGPLINNLVWIIWYLQKRLNLIYNELLTDFELSRGGATWTKFVWRKNRLLLLKGWRDMDDFPT